MLLSNLHSQQFVLEGALLFGGTLDHWMATVRLPSRGVATGGIWGTVYIPPKSVQVDNVVKMTSKRLLNMSIKFYTSPTNFIPPKQISSYAHFLLKIIVGASCGRLCSNITFMSSAVCVLRRAAGKQVHSEVERYGAGYLYRSTTAEKPAVTVLTVTNLILKCM